VKFYDPIREKPKVSEWHRVFAWLPIRIQDYWVWMETYEQRLCSFRKPDHYSTTYWWEFRTVVKPYATSQPRVIVTSGPSQECSDF